MPDRKKLVLGIMKLPKLVIDGDRSPKLVWSETCPKLVFQALLTVIAGSENDPHTLGDHFPENASFGYSND